jgi:spore coat-associated protein N
MLRNPFKPGQPRLAVALAIAALATSGIGATVSGAFFTDSSEVTGNSFTTGTVDLTATPATAAVSMTNMAPGDLVVGSVTVGNSGSLEYRYAMTSTADNTDAKGLAAALEMTVKVGVSDCSAAGFTVDGTVLYGPAPLGDPTGIAVFGDVSPGAQVGDRTVAAGASEILCIRVALPDTTGNSHQDATTTTAFRFDAEQVVNNP